MWSLSRDPQRKHAYFSRKADASNFLLNLDSHVLSCFTFLFPILLVVSFLCDFLQYNFSGKGVNLGDNVRGVSIYRPFALSHRGFVLSLYVVIVSGSSHPVSY